MLQKSNFASLLAAKSYSSFYQVWSYVPEMRQNAFDANEI